MVWPRLDDERGTRLGETLPEFVIVAPSCDPFADFVRAAQAGTIGLHFCVNGQSALRLSRRFPAAVWIVAADLPDMSGFDLVDMLSARAAQRGDEPCPGGDSIHTAIFFVADDYRLVDEQRALAAGVAGFFVHPITLDVIRDSLQLTSAAGAS